MHAFIGQSSRKKTTRAELYLPMRPATSYLGTLSVDGENILKLKLKEIQKIDRRLWYGPVSASSVLSAIIHS